MSVTDLEFKTTVPGDAQIYPPLDLDLGAYGGPPVNVKVTNLGTTDLTGLVLFIRAATGVGDYTLATDDSPETDFQKAVSWGESTVAGVSTAGGIRINFPVESTDIAQATSADTVVVFTDQTADINNAVTDDVVVYTNVTTANEHLYIGMETRFSSLVINVSTVGVAGTTSWEYWDGAAWSALAGVTDGTNGFLNSGAATLVFTVPNDWAATTVDGGSSLLFIRAVSDAGYTTVPIVQQAYVNRLERYVTWTAGSQKSNGFAVEDLGALTGNWEFQLEVETPVPAVGAERVFFDVVIE